MINAQVTDSRGRLKARVSLPLRRGVAATRILDALQKGELTPTGAQNRLVQLDAGSLSVATILSLFRPDEVRQAVEERLDTLGVEEQELQALREILIAHDAARAGGGDSVSRR